MPMRRRTSPGKASSRLAARTTVLMASATGIDGDEVAMIIDATDDLQQVIVTSEFHCEQGSPESALQLAERLRQKSGEAAAPFAEALERAARFCIENRKGRVN